MAIAREAGPVTGREELREVGLDRKDLVQLYRQMLLTRGIEERGHILYRQGKIPGSFYTGRGNEAAAVGVASAMGAERRRPAPTQRDMGAHVARGTEPWRIFAQYMGRKDGFTHGKDGNVHMGELPARDDRDGLPPAGHAAGGVRLRAGVQAARTSRASRSAGSATARRAAATRTRR